MLPNKERIGGEVMENEQIEYTVEYQDGYGVIYFENVKASDLSDAKMQIRQKSPDVTIRAVTVV
jgi:hypothetical protein